MPIKNLDSTVPNGKSFVAEKWDPNVQSGDIWVADVGRDTFLRAPHEPAFDSTGLQSPDGRQLVDSSDRGPTHAIYTIPISGSGSPEKLLDVPGARP